MSSQSLIRLMVNHLHSSGIETREAVDLLRENRLTGPKSAAMSRIGSCTYLWMCTRSVMHLSGQRGHGMRIASRIAQSDDHPAPLQEHLLTWTVKWILIPVRL